MAETAPDEFEDDGCTGVPDKPFRPCCRQHDWEYHLGGTTIDRLRADTDFLGCNWTLAKWYQKPRALAYYFGVVALGGRLGGVLAAPFRFLAGKSPAYRPSWNYRASRYPGERMA